MEVGRNRAMMTNEHITVDSNSYEERKTFRYLSYLLTNKIIFTGNKIT